MSLIKLRIDKPLMKPCGAFSKQKCGYQKKRRRRHKGKKNPDYSKSKKKKGE
jgi:hypothetical protein